MSTKFTFEDSSDEETDGVERSLKFKLLVGKSFRGQTLKEVVATKRGRRYLRWLLEDYTDLRNETRKHIKAVMEFYAQCKADKANVAPERHC